MVKKLLALFAALVVALLIAIVTRPATFRVERSTDIAASPAVAFGYLNDFHQFVKWNPFSKGATDLQQTFSGADQGVGAVYAWSGKETGSGRMEIVESRPGDLVRLNLDFTAPMKANNQVEFRVAPAPGGVKVTWVMEGENTFLGKAISLVASMDQMVGGEFEKGLADLKVLAETHVESPAPEAIPEAIPETASE